MNIETASDRNWLPLHVFREELLDIANRREVATEGAATLEFATAVAAARAVETAERKIASSSASEGLTEFLKSQGRAFPDPRRIARSLQRLSVDRHARAEERKLLEMELKAAEDRVAREAKPTTNLGLVGLSLSGGGVRSATFSFGLLQALAARGFLRHVDYLSTVSGGSYIGGCLSSVLTDPTLTLSPEGFPFRQGSGHADSPPVRRVRDSGQYLAPGGLIDRARIPSLVMIGIIVNLLIVAPYLMLAACLTQWLYGAWIVAYRHAVEIDAPRAPLLIGHELAAMLQGKQDPTEVAGQWISASVDWALSVCSRHGGLPTLAEIPLYTPTFILVAPLLVGVVVFPLIRRLTTSKWMRRDATERAYTVSLILLAIVIPLNTLPLAVAVYEQGVRWPGVTQSVVTILTALGPFVFAARKASGASTTREKLTIYVLGLLAPLLLVLIYVHLAYWLVRHTWNVGMFITAVALIVVAWLVFDVNLTSMHGFYRDRLSKAFLFKLNSSTAVANDTQLLSDLNARGSHSPYHLINATLNLQGSDAPGPRRNSDFFLFSRRFVGGDRTEYCRTGDIERADSQLNLGTAIAISGAALAPNRGSGTVRPLVSVMTLLNVRTGYWLPNPGVVNGSFLGRLEKLLPWTGVGPLYFIFEMLGRLDERRRYVNVSDGGHLENLGLYQLLRRRCKFVVVIDAEEDADMTFNGFARVIRYARIDYGIAIEINVDDLRRTNTGHSGGHYAVGTIDYGDGGQGHLLYVKASLSGDESEDIKEYHSRHPKFPHETTGQQFFNEGQFESYRALGYHIGANLVERELPRRESPTVLGAWFDDLREHSRQRYPRGLDLQVLERELSLIEVSFQDPRFTNYTYQIYPELRRTPAAVTTDDGDQARQIFHLCHRQLRFMETVFVSLALHESHNLQALANLGYLNLFNRWARAPLFREAAATCLEACSPAFRAFCTNRLDLAPARWRLGRPDDLSREHWGSARAASARADADGERESLETQVWIGERGSGPALRRVATTVVQVSANGQERVGTLVFNKIEQDEDEAVLAEILPLLRDTLSATIGGVVRLRYLPGVRVPAPAKAALDY